MGALEVSIASPERILYEGQAESVALPGIKGSFAVLAGHAPLVAELEAGIVKLKAAANDELTFVIDSGFADVRNGKVSVLVEGALMPNEIKKDVEQNKLNEILSSTVAGDAALINREKAARTHRIRISAAE